MPRPDVTPEILGDFDKRSTLRLVRALIGGVVIANLAAYALLAWRPVNRGNWLVTEKWMLLDRSPAVETLVLGDSSCNQGVRPDVLDASLATRSLNLCTVGNLLAVNDAWMLGEYIDKHGAPERVIVVHVYDIWARDADYTFLRLVAKIPRRWGFWHRLEPSLDLGASELEDIVSSRYLPLHAETTSLFTWLTAPRRALAMRFSIDDRGFMAVADPMPGRVAQDLRKHLRELDTRSPVPSLPNQRALRRLDALARQHGFEVTLALAPMSAELWDHPAVRAYVDALRAELRRILGPTSPVRVVPGPPATFAPDQLENVDHVVGDAARVYTEWLARQVTAPR